MLSQRNPDMDPQQKLNLAKKIFEQKKQTRELNDSELPSATKRLSYKSDTYLAMEKMIRNVKKYRNDFCGDR